MTQPTSGPRAKSATGATKGRPRSAARPANGEVRAAIETTLSELTRMGRLEPIDSAWVQMLRSMADALDAKPYNSQMWREFRETLGVLTADGDGSDAIADLLASLRSEVRDTPAP